MDTRKALKWTAVYKGLTWLVGLVGLALVVAPLYFYGVNDLGLGLALDKLDRQPLLAVPVLLGFVVWQVGKTAAYYKTLSEAVDGELAARFDPEMIKSDILSVLDDRLAEMQTQLEGTRRAVEKSGSGGGSGVSQSFASPSGATESQEDAEPADSDDEGEFDFQG